MSAVSASLYRGGRLFGAVALLLFLLLPIVLPAPQLSLPTEIFIFALLALTYDLLFGFTGLISFGHALFIGFGAYTLADALAHSDVSFLLGLLIVVVASALLAAVTGAIALRTRGVYFAMVTLALAQVAFTLSQSDVGGLTGGDSGKTLPSVPGWLVGPDSNVHFYYVSLLLMVAGYLLLRLFVHSPTGRVWQAVRENEGRALTIGYRPFGFKLLAYIIAGTIAGVGGALYAVYVGTVSPSLLSTDITIGLLLMVIIGGAGSLWGAMVGAAVVRYLNHYLQVLSTSDVVTHLPPWMHGTIAQPLLLFGVIYLLLIYFFPQGIAGLVTRLGSNGVPLATTGPPAVEDDAGGALLTPPEAASVGSPPQQG